MAMCASVVSGDYVCLLDTVSWLHGLEMYVCRSRSITFPDPQACPDAKSTAVQPREGIIPGIDFCNHDPEALCRWSVWNPASSRKVCI